MRRFVALLLFLLLSSAPAIALETATPQEVYDRVLKAAYLLEQLGEDGLAAFNDPTGEFAWKDTYVFVIDCDKETIAAHPNQKLININAGIVQCKQTGKYVLKGACKQVNQEKASNQGLWSAYWWPKPGSDTPQRKVSFMIRVPGSNYQVCAGIYDDKITVEELNKTLR